jgi:hypothetical protein
MGHVSIESTAYYLHWVPTLQSLASDRFERRFGQLVQGGARRSAVSRPVWPAPCSVSFRNTCRSSGE